MKLARRHLRTDREAVASTVGTIMALLVFLTFLSLIVNQYVPVWMKDAEAAHMNGAFGQFGEFKGDVDLQMLAAQIATSAGVHYQPITTFSPVTLGVDGVPIFAAPTVGEMASNPEAGPWTVQFVYDINDVNTTVNETSSGILTLRVFNRYYIPQSLAYDNGAVIRFQSDGQIIKAEPSFEVSIANAGTANASLEVSWTLVSLFGSGSLQGTGTEGIHSKVIGVDRQTYEDMRSDLWINHSTEFGLAWYRFANATLARAFGIEPGDLGACPSAYCYDKQLQGDRVIFEKAQTPFYVVQSQWSASRRVYDFSIRILNDWDNNDSALPIRFFHVQHAFANVALGDRGSEVVI